jgi:ATP-dependent exoDNAse (exonuclease V) beta subunit
MRQLKKIEINDASFKVYYVFNSRLKSKTYTIKDPIITNYLTKHHHTRNDLITFKEDGHIYQIENVPQITSVTTWVHSLFPHFNADAVIEKIVASQTWKNGTSPYSNMSATEIKSKWEEKRVSSSSKGTQLHAAIEYYYNLVSFIQDKYGSTSENIINIALRDFTKERELFRQFELDRQSTLTYTNSEGFILEQDFSNWKPFRTEWCIFDEDAHIAGTIDMIFRDGDDYIIMDWKRCPEFKKTNPFESATHPVLAHLPNSNYWHYALQLNIYRYMLKRKYNIIVKQLFLVGIHPDHEKYQMCEIPIMDSTMEKLFFTKK